jgi:hypothetical protein
MGLVLPYPGLIKERRKQDQLCMLSNDRKKGFK